jgi:hypothetical protein
MIFYYDHAPETVRDCSVFNINDAQTDRPIVLTISLIATMNRVILRTDPCATPVSCFQTTELTLPR